MELDFPDDVGDARLAGLAGREVTGLLGPAGAGPAGAIPGEGARGEDLEQERGERKISLLRGKGRDGVRRGGQGHLRPASTSIPGPKQPCSSRSRARACPESRYGPRDAPSRLPVPDSAAASHLTCGNAPSRDWFDGRPKNSPFASLPGTSEVDPSIETTRSPQQNTPDPARRRSAR